MSSYELLELLEFMPERGNFKKAVRGGEYCEDEQIWAQIANELAVLRAAYVPKVKAEEYGSRIHYSPALMRKMIEDAEDQREMRESVYAFATRTPKAMPQEYEYWDDDADQKVDA